ncbi:MAG TPA: SRPBCC domain-containing protein [Thermodesulfobacteriota bacterium]|nr:SRPBCC domain-containing protein [Thermodesulfobacteriota bacterium]
MAKELVVRRSLTIKAPASRVWEILTDPEHTKKYMFGCEAISDWKPGSPLIWKGAKDGVIYVKGQLLALDQEKLFRFTVFDPNSGIEDVPSNYTTVTIELTPGNGSTVLSITQGDFAGMADGNNRFMSAEAGWDMVLPKIKETAEL